VRELAVRVDGAVLAASYSPGGDTAVVAVHGASEGTRDYVLYRHLHEVLPEVGIGVVTFDRRGDGASTGSSSRGRFEVQAADALGVLSVVGVKRVGLWGFSQGGWVAPLAASESPRVAFVVGVASTGVTPSEQMMYATEQQLTRAGYGSSVVQRVLALRRFYEAYVHGRAAGREDELASELLQAMEEPWWLLAFLPPVPLDAEGCRLWIEEMDFDPFPVFQRVQVPALMFYGEDDAWTPVEPSVRTWREARGDAVDVVVVPDASHEMTLPDDTIAMEYEQELVDWLRGLSAQSSRGRPG
jgi:pimeloyl-ACP methyl ester carboxylesterase